ncbi:MAG: LA_2272 family surface repeat-containing protein [Limisphaerales bacterium]
MKKILILTVVALGSTSLRADDSMPPTNMSTMPEDAACFQASLTPAIAIHPRTTEINGLALNIWGENPQHSFNLGIVNGSTGDSSGFSVGVVNYDDSYVGVQWGVVNCSKESFSGWQWGLVNDANGIFNGWQEGVVNISKGTFTGWQDGWVNVSEEVHGLQTGIVNYAEDLNGVQIGLANIAVNNGWFDDFPDQLAKGFPLVNWSF